MGNIRRKSTKSKGKKQEIRLFINLTLSLKLKGTQVNETEGGFFFYSRKFLFLLPNTVSTMTRDYQAN